MLITLWRLRLWALLALVSIPRGSRADPAQILTLHYEAEPGCPDATRFRAEVLARVTRPIAFADQGGTRVLRVRVVSEARGVVAELSIEGPGQSPSLREFRTSGCEDAVRAVALVAALAIDPNASLAADPRAAERPRPPPIPARKEAQVLPRSPVRSPALAVELGPLIAATLGPSPELLSSAGVQLAVDASARAGFLVPRFSGSLLASRTGILSPSLSDGSFTWLLTRLSACPLLFRLGPRTNLRPCWTTDAGLLVARGSAGAIENPETAVRPWFASGVSLRLLQQTGRMVWGGGVGALAALTRDDFVFFTPEPESVHDVPAVVLTAELGLGFTLGSSPQ